ncbi:MAG TPA: aldo/keto reductase [Devosiaceae bacterium]|nr:aldo/keto reductase [Devosiaceae bacterium]
MQKVTLGRTGLEVTAACLGAGGHSRLGQTTGASADQSVALVRAALDLGINFIDTAANYGTEPIVGAAIKGRRDEVVVSTKIAPTHSMDGSAAELITATELRERVELSLARLETDHIDILHLHGVGADQYDYCRDELAPELIRLREAGKLRFLGITERFGRDTSHAVLQQALRDDIWDVFMVGYNLLNQTAAKDILPGARARNIGTMCMFAVRGGLANESRARPLIDDLIGRGEIDRTSIDPTDPFGFLVEDGRKIPLAEAAYRFCRHASGIDVVLTGTGNPAHLEENLRSLELPPLPEAVIDRLRDIFGHVTSASGDPLPAEKS